MKLEDHPTVKRIQVKNVTSVAPTKESLDAGWRHGVLRRSLLLHRHRDNGGKVHQRPGTGRRIVNS
jgi:hypothetical protein